MLSYDKSVVKKNENSTMHFLQRINSNIFSYYLVAVKHDYNRQVGACARTYLPMKMEQSVPKRRHIQFRRRGITQKKAYNIQDTAKV